MLKNLSPWLACCGVGLLLGGCAGNPFERGHAPDADVQADAGATTDGAAPAGDSNAAAVSFTNEVHPILQSRCSACHSPNGTARGSALELTGDALADLPMVRALVVAGQPDESPLLRFARGDEGHEGGAALAATSKEYKTLATWVEQGAK